MLTRDSFAEAVQDAYRHLYDLSYLRTHPLVDFLIAGDVLPPKERAWRLHRLLVEVIDELDPGLASPTVTPEWRRHRLMVLRYQESLGPQEIADMLSISRRHVYRDHDAAMATIVDLLWRRRVAEGHPAATPPAHPAGVDRMELLRRETANLWQEEPGAALDQVIEGLQGLLVEVARQQRVQLMPFAAAHLPKIRLEPALLRQLLIGVLGFVLREASDATVSFDAQVSGDFVDLVIGLHAAQAGAVAVTADAAERFNAVAELAVVNQVQIEPVEEQGYVVGLRLQLPAMQRPTVLIIDDNADTLQLFERFLVPNHYQVVLAQSGEEAVRRAKQIHPDAIVLDLMMPQQDGWDLLQLFRGDENTRTTPVIVCSILRQRELALAFGANAFLEKPVQEASLLRTLAELVR